MPAQFALAILTVTSLDIFAGSFEQMDLLQLVLL